MLAVAHVIAALVIGRTRFGWPLDVDRVNTLMFTLRDARHAKDVSPVAIRATVMTNVIAVRLPSARWMRIFIAFRDEMTANQWRDLTTALRHQPRRSVRWTLVKKPAAIDLPN